MSSAYSQTCNICSQADVDNYVLDPSGLHLSNLYISGSDITNLDGLNGIKNIFLGSLRIYDSPILEDVDGLSQLEQVTYNVVISNNPLLKSIEGLSSLIISLSTYDGTTSQIVTHGLEIVNNDMLDTIHLPAYIEDQILITNNELLSHLDFPAITSSNGIYTISDNPTLKNLDGLAQIPAISQLTIMNNTNLYGYCGLNKIVFNDINAPISLSGNLVNPSNQEILYEGTCGNFVRNFTGYPTFTEALLGAKDHEFIFVARDHTIDVTTTFPATQNQTLVIKPYVTLRFNAPFTNESIVINHGTLEMINGAQLTNKGALVNTGMLIIN
jgi:hypothetical protein